MIDSILQKHWLIELFIRLFESVCGNYFLYTVFSLELFSILESELLIRCQHPDWYWVTCRALCKSSCKCRFLRSWVKMFKLLLSKRSNLNSCLNSKNIIVYPQPTHPTIFFTAPQNDSLCLLWQHIYQKQQSDAYFTEMLIYLYFVPYYTVPVVCHTYSQLHIFASESHHTKKKLYSSS